MVEAGLRSWIMVRSCVWLGADVRCQGDLGCEDVLGLGLSMERLGAARIFLVHPLMLYKLICYSSSVKEPCWGQEENGAQKG